MRYLVVFGIKLAAAGFGLIVHYFEHWLVATGGVFMFMALMLVFAVTLFVICFNFSSAYFTLKHRHNNSQTLLFANQKGLRVKFPFLLAKQVIIASQFCF
jgi:hypothetical protein